MATFVLIHGGWDGGWAWRESARELQAAGHDVFTPTLTGSGERVHLASPEVGLHTHIYDIVNVLHYENLTEVILVGASYGGMVITGVAEQVPERIAQLIYLDAFVPQHGQSLNTIIGPELAAAFAQVAQHQGDGWRVPHTPPDADRRTDLLIKVAEHAVDITNPAAARLKHTYVLFTDKSQDDFLKPLMEAMAARARAQGWSYREMPFPHFPLLDRPHEVAQLLLDLIP
jgi:pimeloyl-ACP methyl ester carboxylesterase